MKYGDVHRMNKQDENHDNEDESRLSALAAIPDKVRRVTEDALARDFVSEDGTFRHNGQ